MHQGAITDELPESYNAATTFGTANRQSSQTAIPPAYKDMEQTQYAALSFQSGTQPPKGGEAKGVARSSADDFVTYSAVTTTTKGPEGLNLLPNEERYTSASPEVGPATSMV